MIKVIIYEDNTLLRESLTMLIGGTPGFDVVAAFEECNKIVEQVEAFTPHVVLLDIDMPEISGIEALKLLRKKDAEVKVLMLTIFDDDRNVFEAIQYGANGYLLKKTPPAKLLEYITDVCSGGAPMTSSIARQVLQMFAHAHGERNGNYNLSERETETLKHLVNGFSYKMIAAEMHISIDTVRAHIKKVYEKLQVNSKGEAVAKAFKDRIL
jgi:DNA-binding NarL/FixJ family response regulator